MRWLSRVLPSRRRAIDEEIATHCNSRVGQRLAEVLTRIHADDPTLFDAGERAGYLATKFRIPVTVAGVSRTPPP